MEHHRALVPINEGELGCHGVAIGFPETAQHYPRFVVIRIHEHGAVGFQNGSSFVAFHHANIHAGQGGFLIIGPNRIQQPGYQSQCEKDTH